jgi:GNAT superfamily N-acetyltransferase
VTRLELRSATPRDATAVASLLAELGYPVAEQDIPERLAATVAEGGVVLLAVNDDGVPVGLMCLARHRVLHAVGPVAYITALVVSATARGLGVGRALVAAALDWARTNDCVRLSVTSAEHRADAHAFYPRCGMPYTGRRFSAAVTK